MTGRSQGAAAPREVQRVRDMPAPRRNESAAGGVMGWVFQWPYRGILAFLLWTRVKPWQLTVASPILICLSGVFIITGDWFVAGWVLLAGGLCDVFDGSVARHRGEVKRSGAFMDSLIDRVADAIVFACLFWVFADRGDELEASLALITLIVSLSVSYVRAEAEAAGVRLTEGLFQRLERFLALMIALLIPGMMLPMLILLATLGTLTVLQRAFLAVKGA
jgi:CDP-diacylglycerol---glycerol-3-phosphate 3-phosphatidyltransferase